MKRINIYPEAHLHRIDKDNNVQIVLRVDLGGDPVCRDRITQTKIRVNINDWDRAKRAIKPNSPINKLYNNHITNRTNKIKEDLLRAELEGTLTRQAIIDIIQGKKPDKRFKETCLEIIALNYTNKGTAQNMVVDVNLIDKFRPGINFSDIDHRFLAQLESYMRITLKHKDNTISKRFDHLETLFNLAIKFKATTVNPLGKGGYQSVRYKEPEKEYLSDAEVDKIENLLNKPIQRKYVQVIKYFVLSCRSGLRFEDLKKFRPSEHIINDHIVMETSKEKVKIHNKLYPKLREIIDTIREPLKIENSTFNDLLKEIAELAGISKNLSAHVGRHTMGRELRKKGFSKEDAQRFLGHADIKSTGRYFHDEVDDLDKAIDEKLGK